MTRDEEQKQPGSDEPNDDAESEQERLAKAAEWRMSVLNQSSSAQDRFRRACEGTIGDNYEVVRELGRGGMGVVLLVRNRNLDGRFQALKRPNRDSAHLRRGFKHEMKAWARLLHPNVCRIERTDSDWYGPYIVMEYVEGGSLGDAIVRSGSLSSRHVFELGVGILRGLKALHGFSPKIIHRDIKPANILLGEGGIPKITDFGLAKLEGATGLSKGGALLGTEGFVAPEQLLSPKLADERSDIYGFGLTLKEALTGQAPGLSPLSKVPAVFRDYIASCTDEDPLKRFKCADAALAALEQLESRIQKVPGRDDCPSCHHRTNPSANHCSNCGNDLTRACARCDTVQRHYHKSCEECGVVLDDWPRMLALLDEAWSGSIQLDYETAYSKIADAEAYSSGHRDYHALASKRKEDIEELRSLRNRVEELQGSGRFEETEGPLRQVLSLTEHQDESASLALEQIPRRIRQRELERAIRELDTRVNGRELELSLATLAEVDALIKGLDSEDSTGLLEQVESSRKRLVLQAKIQFGESLEAADWSSTKQAYDAMVSLGTPRQELRINWLRFQMERALVRDRLALSANHRLELNQVLERLEPRQRPWLDDFRSRLLAAQQELLRQGSERINRARHERGVAGAEEILSDLWSELGEEFPREVKELEKKLRQRKTRNRLRGLSAIGALVSIIAMGGWLLVASMKRVEACNSELMAMVAESAARNGEPVPEWSFGAGEGAWGSELLPESWVHFWANSGLLSSSELLESVGLNGMTTDEAESLWKHLDVDNSSTAAKIAFKDWETSTKKEWLPAELTLNLEFPRLYLENIDVSTLEIDGVPVNGSKGPDGKWGFDPPKYLRGKRPRTVSIEIEGISVDISKDCDLLVDLEAPKIAAKSVPGSAPEPHEPARYMLEGEKEDLHSVQFQTSLSESSDDWAAPSEFKTLELSGSKEVTLSPGKLSPFFRKRVYLRVTDTAGNVSTPELVHEFTSEEEVTAETILNNLEEKPGQRVANLRDLDELFLRSGVDAALLANTPSSKPSYLERKAREFREHALASSPQITLKTSDPVIGPLAVPIRATSSSRSPRDTELLHSKQYLIGSDPLSIRIKADGAIRDSAIVERRTENGWEPYLEISLTETGPVRLMNASDSDRSEWKFRVGTAYLPKESWTEFTVHRDLDPPTVESIKLFYGTSRQDFDLAITPDQRPILAPVPIELSLGLTDVTKGGRVQCKLAESSILTQEWSEGRAVLALDLAELARDRLRNIDFTLLVEDRFGNEHVIDVPIALLAPHPRLERLDVWCPMKNSKVELLQSKELSVDEDGPFMEYAPDKHSTHLLQDDDFVHIEVNFGTVPVEAWLEGQYIKKTPLTFDRPKFGHLEVALGAPRGRKHKDRGHVEFDLHVVERDPMTGDHRPPLRSRIQLPLKSN